MLLQEGSRGLAQVMSRRAEEIDADDPWSAIYRAELLIAAEQYAAAEELLAPILELDESRRIYLGARLQLIEAYRRSSQSDSVGPLFDELMEYDPQNRRRSPTAAASPSRSSPAATGTSRSRAR